MSRRARRIWLVVGGVAIALLVAGLSVILILRSAWFRGRVRDRIITEVEKATGGRTQIGAFQFDWEHMRAEVDGFTLHGTEPADGPPLFKADSIVLGIKVISVLKRSVDLQYLDVRRPQVYLILYPDGRTNMPAPKIKRTGKGAVDTILDLAIGRFGVQQGTFELSGQGKTPFDAQVHNLHAQFDYDRGGPRYRGQLSMAPARFHWGKFQPVPVDIGLALDVEKNRVHVASGRLSTGRTQVEFSGGIDSLTDFQGAFQYKVHAALGEVSLTFNLNTVLEGPATLVGKAAFHGTSNFQASGSLHVSGVLFHPDPHFTLRDLRADGSFNIDPNRIAVSDFRLAGLAMASLTGEKTLQPFPVTGRMESIVIRNNNLDATGVHLETLNGVFTGKTRFADLRHVHVEGDVAGFDVRDIMRIYDGQPLPWDAGATGPMQLNVTLGNTSTLRLNAQMAVAPTSNSAPVHGAVNIAYDGEAETLDLGTSTLSLPSTRLDFSGVLGRQLHVHADSRNIDDVLPAFDVKSIPLKLQNGEAVFDGTVTGKLADPRIVGHGNATNVLWSGRSFTALSGDVDLTGAGIAVRNGSAQQGSVRAQGSGSLGMNDWKIEDSSPLAFAGVIRNAPAPDLMAALDIRNVPLEGTVTAEGKIAGTLPIRASTPRSPPPRARSMGNPSIGSLAR